MKCPKCKIERAVQAMRDRCPVCGYQTVKKTKTEKTWGGRQISEWPKFDVSTPNLNSRRFK